MNSEDRMREQIGEEVSKHTAKKVGQVVGIVGATFAGIFFVLFFGFLLGWVIKFLWNYTLVDLFDLPSITYWQAVAIFILAKFLFGFGHSGHSKHKRRKDRRHGRHADRRYSNQELAMEGVPASGDEAFQSYWRTEGKAAFEAYLATRKTGGDAPKG